MTGYDIDHFDARGLRFKPGIVQTNDNHFSDSREWHTQVMFSLLWYAAPQANFYHYAEVHYGMNYQDQRAQFIINNFIQTVSCSYTAAYSANWDEMLLIDDFAYSYPYPVFCNPAANDAPTGGIVNWGCYNAISVGASHQPDLNHYEWAAYSNYVNPPAFISGSPADREMPYVLAPGTPPYDVNNPPWDYHCMNNGQPVAVGWDYESALLTPFCTNIRGTSLSAPVANGIAADVISANSNFIGWPEKVRAALMVTAQNCDGGEWDASVDGKDGAGAILGTNAVLFAQNHTAISGPNNTAAQDGLYASSWYSTETTQKQFYILVPNPKPANKHLRVVVTWDSRPDLTGYQNYLSDLDLVVKPVPGGQGSYGASASWNGNVEIVDVPGSSLSAGSTIQAIVTPCVFRFSSYPDFFYYSIGWTWVADHAQ